MLEQSYNLIVGAEQRVVLEGSSPSGAQMRSVISESGDKTSLAGSSLRFLGHPCGACLGLETPASRRELAITVAARYCLPLAQTRRPRNDTRFRG
jgi:hypothetical protein